MVLFRAAKLQSQEVGRDYPAIVYNIHSDPTMLGLCVIYDGTPSRYGIVSYSAEPKEFTWRLPDALT